MMQAHKIRLDPNYVQATYFARASGIAAFPITGRWRSGLNNTKLASWMPHFPNRLKLHCVGN